MKLKISILLNILLAMLLCVAFANYIQNLKPHGIQTEQEASSPGNVSIGWNANVTSTDLDGTVAIGKYAEAVRNSAALGNYSKATNDHELVVRFTDGSEMR